jgi:DNA end-binding protein Ku
MRTAFKGTVTFGLLSIPIRMGTAMDTRASLFHHTHKKCATRIKQKRWCDTCACEIPEFSEVGKGVELADETMALVTDEDLDVLRGWDNKTVKLIHFTPAGQVDVRLYDQTYYVEPVDGGAPAYTLLLAAMPEGMAAVCTIGYRDRAALALLLPAGGHFELVTLRWPAELRTCDVTIPPVQPARPQEIKMASQLIRSMTRDFDPAEHTDTYTEALVRLVSRKQAGTPAAAARPVNPATPYTNMMELLQASIAEQKTATKAPARRRATAKAS